MTVTVASSTNVLDFSTALAPDTLTEAIKSTVSPLAAAFVLSPVRPLIVNVLSELDNAKLDELISKISPAVKEPLGVFTTNV